MAFLDKIKGVADQIGDSVGKGVKNVKDNSKTLSRKMKLKGEMKQLDSEIEAAYTAIGKKYFELNSDAPGEDYSKMVTSIIEKKAKAEKIQSEINLLEDKIVCPSCGESIEFGKNFCDKCGASLAAVNAEIAKAAEEAAVEKKRAARTCSSCGTVVGDDEQKFCENCGNSLSKDETVEEVTAEVITEPDDSAE